MRRMELCQGLPLNELHNMPRFPADGPLTEVTALDEVRDRDCRCAEREFSLLEPHQFGVASRQGGAFFLLFSGLCGRGRR
ncbi:hypothetical protein D3C80_1520040 [compost metagenome]